MPNTIVNLGDLQAMVDKYREALAQHDGVSLKANGEPAERANPADIDMVVSALDTVSMTISKICQQPVLAVRLTER